MLSRLLSLLGLRPGDRPDERPDEPRVTSDANPIRDFLDTLSLPWRLPRADLARIYGVRSHPAYRWEVIEIPTEPPIVQGLIWPLSVQVFAQFTPKLPAIRFSGHSWFGPDARANLRRTADQLVRHLGPADIAPKYNTVQCEWRSGAATLRLLVWPPDMQSGHLDNPAQKREPRLVTACSVTIETGFRLTPTQTEQAWLDSFTPIGPIKGDRRMVAADIHTLQAPEAELEYIRVPGPDIATFFNQVGTSADRRALIFCHRQLYLIACNDIIGLRVQRVLPAKGGGGSRLEAECGTKRITIGQGDAAEDLNDLAAAVAAAIGKPFELCVHTYDD